MSTEGPSLPELEPVTLQLADVPDCVRLARGSFDAFEARPDAVARWFDARIRHNPWQGALPGIGVGLRAEGELVAYRAMFAQPWWLQGRSETVAFAAHTAVSPRLRGQGVGTRLIDASRATARITGSTTAGDITQKAYARLGFTPIGGADNQFFRWRISITGSLQSRLGGIAGRAAGRLADVSVWLRDRRLGATAGWRAEPLARCGDEVNALWLRERAVQTSCLERSSRYLHWRLFDQPTARLQATALRDAGGTLRAAVLRDLMAGDADEATLHRLLRLLAAHWREQGFSWASLEVSTPRLTAVFRALGFEHVPSRGNRYWVSASPPLAPEVSGAWFRSALDGDYFDTDAA